MNKDKEIERKVEAALNSFEGIQPASPGAFFYTRVHARLYRSEKNIWDSIGMLIARPAVAVTVICTILLMNVLVLFQQKNVSPPLADQSEQSYYDDFNNTADNFYDFAFNEH